MIILCSIQQRHVRQLHVAHLCDPHDKRKERSFWRAQCATQLAFSGINEMILEALEREIRNES